MAYIIEWVIGESPLGHRREVFRPRKSKKKIERSLEQSLEQKEFQKTAQLAISHYTKRSTALDFATAITATSEAISIAKDLKWSRSVADIANMAISVAESRTEKRLSTFRRKTVLELVTKSLEKAKEESQSE